MSNFRRHAYLFAPVLLALTARAAEPVVDWDKAKAETLLHYQAVVRINTSNPPVIKAMTHHIQAYRE